MGGRNEKQGNNEAKGGFGPKSEPVRQFNSGDVGAATMPVRIRTVRWIYGLLAAGYLACVVVQVFFAGLGILVDPGDLQLHRVFANVFEFVPIVMFVLSFLGDIRGGLRWWPLALFALTALQHITIQKMWQVRCVRFMRWMRCCCSDCRCIWPDVPGLGCWVRTEPARQVRQGLKI